MSLDDLERQLYQERKDTAQTQHTQGVMPESPRNEEIHESPEWEEDKRVLASANSRNRIIHIIKWAFALLVAFSIVGGGIFFALQYGANSKGIAIDIQTQKKVNRGVPFEVNVQISNDIDTPVKDGSLSITLTQGLLSAEVTAQQKGGIIKESVGDLAGGSLTTKTFRLLAIGETNSVQKVTIKFSFVSGRGVYELEQSKEIAIGDPAISIEVKKPDQVASGSKFDMQINYRNNSNVDFSDVSLDVKYPPEYRFLEASYNTASLNNFWRLGEVKAGTSGSIQITGILDASEKSSFDFISSVFVTLGGKDYKVNDATTNIFIAPAPIVVEVKTSKTAHPGDKLSYTITYENKSGISLADAVIEAKLEGVMFDFGSLRAENGSFDSRTNTISWNASRVPELALLPPNAKGEVNFSIALLPKLPVTRMSDKNFTVKVDARMDSPSVPYYISGDATTGFGSSMTKIAGVVEFKTQAYYRDPFARIVNLGTVPPKVNAATQYTVHWILKNYGSDLRNVTVHGSLEGGVRWTGVVKSTIDIVPEYNPRTQEIVWNIPKIDANRGLFDDPVEVVFQVEVVPSIVDVGRYKSIVDTVIYAGIDDFTDLQFSGRGNRVTTEIPDDSTLSKNDGIVIQ